MSEANQGVKRGSKKKNLHQGFPGAWVEDMCFAQRCEQDQTREWLQYGW